MRDAGGYIEGVPEPDLEDIAGSYLDAGGEFLVGELDGHIVTTGAFRPASGPIVEYLESPADAAELKRMRVDPAHQREGYGRQVYEELQRRAEKRGFRTLALDTMPELTAARRLYESVGFETVGRQRFRRQGTTFELLFYRKRL